MQSTLSSSLPLSHRPLPLENSLLGRIVLTIAATEFVALCAHVSLPLPFTVVPLTLQTFAVILVGMLFGPVVGFSSMVLYLAEGATGLPVFSPHGLGGIAQLVGPTGGYLVSYPLAAACAGFFTRNVRLSNSNFRNGIIAGVVASAPIFALGALWLTHYQSLGISSSWQLAVVPFLPGEVIKITAAAGIFSSMQRWRQSQN
jgi:biotin transport system substrate-specific component